MEAGYLRPHSHVSIGQRHQGRCNHFLLGEVLVIWHVSIGQRHQGRCNSRSPRASGGRSTVSIGQRHQGRCNVPFIEKDAREIFESQLGSAIKGAATGNCLHEVQTYGSLNWAAPSRALQHPMGIEGLAAVFGSQLGSAIKGAATGYGTGVVQPLRKSQLGSAIKGAATKK